MWEWTRQNCILIAWYTWVAVLACGAVYLLLSQTSGCPPGRAFFNSLEAELDAALLRMIPGMGCEPIKLGCQAGKAPGDIFQHGRAFLRNIRLSRQGFGFGRKLLAFGSSEHCEMTPKIAPKNYKPAGSTPILPP
jgi:hypothetical protein